MAPLLEIENLKTEFRLRTSTVTAVDSVSLTVGEGESVGLVGESGCGKTTVGLSIMQLLPNVGHVVGGSIRLAGRDLVPLTEKEMSEVRGEQIGMVFQDPLTSLNPTMTIGNQIGESVRLHRGATKQQARERALEVLRLVEMPRPEERLDAYPHQLSGGLRQRVMIAMALACEPKLLIADEPTTALDVTIQAQILDLLDRLRAELGMSVILITHDLAVVAARTDRVLVMYAGKIIEVATTDDLYTEMRHPYAEALLASVAKLDQDASVPLVSIAGLPPDLSRPIDHCRFSARCRYGQPDCTQREPPLVQASNAKSGHLAACFHQVDVDPNTIAKRPEAVAKSADVSVKVDEVGLARQRARADSLARQPVLVKLDHVVKEFPVTAGAVLQRKVGTVKAVSDISLTIRQGETFGLVGESGCGKTTIGRLVVALERVTSGSIEVEGKQMVGLGGRELRRVRRHMQMMFQDPYASLDPRMRVGAILKEPLDVQGVGSAHERRKVVEGLLQEVGLPKAAADLYPHEFSGGQRQRIGLARALALDPNLIVADEPVSALDVSIQAQILNLLKTMQARHGLSYLFISHDLAIVKYMADTMAVMYLGKVVETGPARHVYEHAAHPYTGALIETIPVPDPAVARGKRGHHIRGELPSSMNPPSGCRFRTRCPHAQEVCAEEEPALRPFGPGHLAACHFPLQAPTGSADETMSPLTAGTPAG
ncbi:MAG TPA: ABC transporter ATP-binding protein [Acidimicrobiales bacterium]|nr:ABC transporter ATP-binding protein [Acidimicrobiales bacterium]